MSVPVAGYGAGHDMEDPTTVADMQSLAIDLPAGIDASELHGLTCGLYCGDPTGELESQWRALVELLGQESQRDVSVLDEPTPDAADPLAQFVRAARDGLDAADLGFEPLLPDDDAHLRDRIDALALWCRGFVAGFNAVQAPDDLAADAREALDDIAALAEIDSEASGTDAAAERDFAEVAEYLRVAVLVLRGAGPEDLIDERS
jgi:uncharacterized protein